MGEGGEEGFGEGGVGVDAGGEGLGGEARGHGQGGFGNEVGGVGAADVASFNEVGALPVVMSMPAARHCSSVRPTMAHSGMVNTADGITDMSTFSPMATRACADAACASWQMPLQSPMARTPSILVRHEPSTSNPRRPMA